MCSLGNMPSIRIMKNWHDALPMYQNEPNWCQKVGWKGFLKNSLKNCAHPETYTHIREEVVYWLYTCLNPFVRLSTLRPSFLHNNAHTVAYRQRLPASATLAAGVSTNHHDLVLLSNIAIMRSDLCLHLLSVVASQACRGFARHLLKHIHCPKHYQ